MTDPGRYFDDKPMARLLLVLVPVVLVWLITIGIGSGISRVDEMKAKRAGWHGWSTDWRGRPRREILPMTRGAGGANPSVFSLTCRKDADGKVSHAIIEDPDGLPGLEDLQPGEQLRVHIDIPERARGQRWSEIETVWHLEEPGRLVSENDLHGFFTRMRHIGTAEFTLRDRSGREARLELPYRGLDRAADKFFDRCKVPLMRPNYYKTHEY